MRALFLFALLATVEALAQKSAPRGESPTVGVAVPVGAIAGSVEATAVELNAANLAFLPSWSAIFVHTELDNLGVRGGRGDALYLATPLPLLNQWAVGVSVQSVRPPQLFPYRDVAKLSLSLAWRPLGGVALGATYAHILTGDTPGSGGIDTLDLAMSVRAQPWLTAGLVVHDVPAPQFQGLALQRVYEPELAVRPLGDERIELGVAARIGERRGDVDPRLRLQVVPWPGLLFRGALELRRDIDGDRVAENDLRATVGIELNFERWGVGGYGLFGGASGGSHFHGVAAQARLSGDRYPAVGRPVRYERIDLAGEGDRARVRLLAHLEQILHERSVAGVVLVVGDLGGSWATMEELRGALVRLRQAHKHVYAYGAELTTKSYYVASAAERIWLDPSGGIRLIGLAQTATYLRGSLDLLGVQADFIRIAEYKAAPEQYTRTGPSPEAKWVRQAILDDIFGRVVGELAAARHIDAAQIRALIDRGPFTAAEAKAAGLVDALAHGDEIETEICADGCIERMDLAPRRSRSWQLPEIGVLFVEGDIIDGKSQTIPIADLRLVGHQTVIEALTKLRADDHVRAIVLRINSPGGSALASDLIAHEIALTRKVKPVVCSLGDVAASGGYFIASMCDRIIAAPSTITGSIGIFTGKFDISGLAAKLGVSVDVNKRGEHADIESFWRPYSEDERKLILEKLRYFYGRFLETVATGRKMKVEEVDAVGRGRVWTGAQALANHLVDRLGNFQDALAEAKQRAGLTPGQEVELRAFPEEPTTLLGQLAQRLGIKLDERVLPFPGFSELLRALPGSLLVAPSTAQARMEVDLQQ